MDWRTWDVAGWNQALVEAIFLDKERLGIPITRIQASGKFLAKCTRDPGSSPAEAARHFVRAFGVSAPEIRRGFAWSRNVEARTVRDGMPGVVASLYLTLLAASADETTYDEGNFRNRFVELLKPLEIVAPSFGDLPRLWQHVEKWSVSRASRHGDCRVLRLPVDIGHEKLIGYSKRLAFPGYSDETKLQRLLQEERLDDGSDPASVARSIARRINRFSASFQEEFRVFNGLVAKARLQAAAESPFWNAVQAITWELAYEVAREYGSFCLGVDLSDPLQPDCYLLIDAVGRQQLNRALRFKDAASQTIYKHVALPPNAQRWTIAALLAIPRQWQGLGHTRLWRQFASGCVVLFPDQYGNLNSDGEHSDGDPACFIVQESLGDRIQKTARGLGVETYKFIDDEAAGWMIIVLQSISSRTLSRLSLALPEGMLASQWRPPRISLSGGAWFGQSILLSPASTPFATMPEASHGRYQILGDEAKILADGVLEDVEHKFRIPPAELPTPTPGRSVRFSLVRHDGLHANATVPLAADLPLGPPTRLKDPGSWIVDGPDGSMRGLAEGYGPARSGHRPRWSEKGMPWKPRLARIQRPSWEETLRADLDELPEILCWLCEALLLRYQRRSTLPYAELASHVEPASEFIGLKPRQVFRVLVCSGWLQRVQRRNSPFGAFVPSRTIARVGVGSGTVARIVGMLSGYERSCLAAMLQAGESVSRIGGATGSFGLGAIELCLAAPERMGEIARQFDLEILEKAGFGAPITMQSSAAYKRDTVFGVPKGEELQMWDKQRFEWRPAASPADGAPRGSAYRLRGSQGERFWISTGDSYLSTESWTWARILELAVVGEPIGLVADSGDCRFHEAINDLPSSLVRWWMHWGGGHVSVDGKGGLVLGGSPGPAIWDALGDWLQDSEARQASPNQCNAAMERRNLALRVRLHRRRPA